MIRNMCEQAINRFYHDYVDIFLGSLVLIKRKYVADKLRYQKVLKKGITNRFRDFFELQGVFKPYGIYAARKITAAETYKIMHISCVRKQSL